MPNIEAILRQIKKTWCRNSKRNCAPMAHPGGRIETAANDMRADNVVLEIEYGELEGERIGNGIVTALRLINNREINEEILYGRMENIEQSTLVS